MCGTVIEHTKAHDDIYPRVVVVLSLRLESNEATFAVQVNQLSTVTQSAKCGCTACSSDVCRLITNLDLGVVVKRQLDVLQASIDGIGLRPVCV